MIQLRKVFLGLCLLMVSDHLFSDEGQKLSSIFTPSVKQHFSKTYGHRSSQILDSWLQLIKDNQEAPNWKKLRMVNFFFNSKIKFVSDSKHWNKSDYWATPVEFIGTQGGDCEDFAIAKYFTLKAMGVATDKLRLMYVRALAVDQAHMVLIYSETLSDIPLVLDNINKKILPATRRRDLKPIYSFNGDGLWQAKAKGLGKQLKGKGYVTAWDDVVTRIERGDFQKSAD